MFHVYDIDGIRNRELEQFWFFRLRHAREQYRQAGVKLRSLLDASRVAEPSDDADLVAAAHEAESYALAEYRRVLAIFTTLVEKRNQL
jgi:hypothetical protein